MVNVWFHDHARSLVLRSRIYRVKRNRKDREWISTVSVTAEAVNLSFRPPVKETVFLRLSCLPHRASLVSNKINCNKINCLVTAQSGRRSALDRIPAPPCSDLLIRRSAHAPTGDNGGDANASLRRRGGAIAQYTRDAGRALK
jgi:hypothetical protein